MNKILKYSLYDLVRSRWMFFYFGFFLLFTLGLFWLSPDISKVAISMMNIILILVPLIATMFGLMYFYNSREFTELLLAQPIPRQHIFLGQYLGVAGSLSLSFLLGMGVPFLLYGLTASSDAGLFLTLLVSGVLLSFIFSGISFYIALKNDNRIRGFGIAILVWLLLAVAYDGFLLLGLAHFSDYPLEKYALGASLFNPIDLSRILILLKLDIAALMGFTGAVFKKFLGSNLGMIISLVVLLCWVLLPLWSIRRASLKKDF